MQCIARSKLPGAIRSCDSCDPDPCTSDSPSEDTQLSFNGDTENPRMIDGRVGEISGDSRNALLVPITGMTKELFLKAGQSFQRAGSPEEFQEAARFSSALQRAALGLSGKAGGRAHLKSSLSKNGTP